jgi:hypothetical protein
MDQAHQQIVIVLASATLHYRGAIDSGGVALSWHVAGTGLRRHRRHLGKRRPNADMWEIMIVAAAAISCAPARRPHPTTTVRDSTTRTTRCGSFTARHAGSASSAARRFSRRSRGTRPVRERVGLGFVSPLRHERSADGLACR